MDKSKGYDSYSGEEDEEMSSPIDVKKLQQNKNKNLTRNSVSAEAYGVFNKKTDFKPVVIPKSKEATLKI